MTEPSQYKLILPQHDGTTTELSSNQSILLIGANGSGKTRLGTWIEMYSPSLQRDRVHRLSAQKSLSMPDTVTPTSIELAEKDLRYGYADTSVEHRQHYKTHNKWQNKPAVSLLNDYQKLMVYLFSDETEENAKYKASMKNLTEYSEPPETKMDLVKKLWEKILPHRELIIGGLRIQTQVKGVVEKTYNSSEMSDGERVIFYLIGQCLAAQKNAIIVIDEPELHLHKSVQTTLWNEIEKIRTDCLFIYLTHDVDFASAKEGAKRIWLKSFDGQVWDWEELKEDDDLPSELMLEVLGSRKPIVFVEGDNGSHDVSLYRALLPDFLVIPRGSCTQVIQSVKALKANTQLHHLNVYGLIDRDRRVDTEIQSLERDSIFVLKVAEVENLFCVREVLEIISKRLARNANDDFDAVSKKIFSNLNNELETQISLHVASEIKFRLNKFDENKKGADELKLALQSLAASINVDEIYMTTKVKFDNVRESNDYEGLLSLYNRKSLASQVSGALGLANGKLGETIVNLAKGDSQAEIANALRKYFGNFGQYIA